ncbi:MAG: hypothetical protein CMF76_10755 [Maricaulis sp.]|nr:hypothetical protein [Oceanicaulis sp.]MAZ92424.1 hypothetical protein [Maricaulis sp.]|tara:strand:- start:289 stop:513 length:225 start_codon:yes stop_codon:yes gene_type:complete
MTKVDFEKALLDPAGTFDEPEDVVRNDALSREQKKEILERWQHDAEELVVASGEGMPGGGENQLRKVGKALDAV